MPRRWPPTSGILSWPYYIFAQGNDVPNTDSDTELMSLLKPKVVHLTLSEQIQQEGKMRTKN